MNKLTSGINFYLLKRRILRATAPLTSIHSPLARQRPLRELQPSQKFSGGETSPQIRNSVAKPQINYGLLSQKQSRVAPTGMAIFSPLVIFLTLIKRLAAHLPRDGFLFV